MKLRLLGLVAAACAALSAQPRPAPFVPVAVRYVARAGTSRDGIARDFRSIHAMGFNAIETPIRWADAEPFRGKYVFDGLERVFDAAAQSDLRVIASLDHVPPEWVLRRYSDGRRIPENRKMETRPGPQVCFDHPGVREDLRSFVAAASAYASRFAALYAVDVFGDPPDGFCACPQSARRMQEFRSKGIAARGDFLRMSIRDDLKLMADAARAQTVSHARMASILRTAEGEPPQDDWLMSEAVHAYGTSITSAMLSPDRFAFVLDGMAAAGRRRGWWMRADASVPSADRRFAAWAAIARGARLLGYAGPPERATFEAVITRNPSLFGQLKPSRSKVAILYDPRDDSGAAGSAIAKAHAALFQHNIPVEFVHIDEIATSTGAARYLALVVTSGLATPASATDALKQFVSSGGTVVNAADPSLTSERLLQLLALARVTPIVKIDGGRGVVETRFLESDDVLMVIGLNHGSVSQKVTMTFAPETQEAIWQNMETGAGVNFVAGPSGPTYEYWFAPRDALVLMIKKTLR